MNPQRKMMTTPTYLSSPFIEGGDFIRRCRPLLLERFNGICVACKFEVDAFERDLFGRLGIVFPPALARAREPRQAEYLAGRYAVRCALQYLNLPALDVLPGLDRSPQWPQSITGSISHSDNMAVCAVSRDGEPVGIDLQRLVSSTECETLSPQILNAREQALLSMQFSGVEALGFSIAFSAKESFYKAVYPRLQKRFGFRDVEITAVDPQTMQLELKPLGDLQTDFLAGARYSLRWMLLGDFVLTYSLQTAV